LPSVIPPFFLPVSKENTRKEKHQKKSKKAGQEMTKQPQEDQNKDCHKPRNN
jgi:hypothetical protein